MKVPFLDLNRAHGHLKDEILQEVSKIIDSNAFVLGEGAGTFENNFSDFVDAKYTVGVSSGLDALKLAIQALNLPEGSEIITAANTFIATTFAISHSKMNVKLVDCDERTYTLDPKKLESAIGPNTKAIIPVHLYGQPADMGPILEIAQNHKLKIVEDAAQAHGAKYNGRNCGGMGDLGCFSFYPGKNLGAMGEGGAVTSNSEELVERIRSLRDVGQTQKYHHDYLGHNFRLHGIQGAILNVKLRDLEKQNASRNETAGKYREQLGELDQIVLPYQADYSDHVYHLFVVQCKRKEDRDGLLNFLAENNIGAGIHYPIPIHLQNAYKFLDYNKGDFTVTEALAESIVSLPIFPYMTDDEVGFVCEKVKEFFQC